MAGPPARLGVALKDLGARLLQLVLHREGELLDVRDATQARELRRQLESLGDEPLIFAIEEETDLAKRFDVLFIRQLHHLGRI